MKIKRKILPAFLCALAAVLFAMPVSAARNGTLTVRFSRGGVPVSDAEFTVRRVGEWNGDAYKLVSPFSDYSAATPDGPDNDGWKALASTLAAYAARDGIPALSVLKTDANGELVFENLPEGLYLVTGATVELEDGTRLFPQPMLVTVPFTETDGSADYDVVTEPKYDEESGEKVNRNVIKVWKDSQNKQKRPRDVTVQLLCDGDVYDERTLGEENNWRYEWEGLDAAHTWQLTEKNVPDDYTVSVTREGITFTVENMNDNPPPPPPRLPQTGIVWWPVPVLAVVGAAVFGVGVYLLLRKKHDA